MAALGIRDASQAQLLDAAEWTCLPRRRLFLSTLPPTVRRGRIPRRSSPWEPGWSLAPDGRAPTMLLARSPPGEPVRVSTYQYGPGSLLYHGPACEGAPLNVRAGRIRAAMPAHLREDFTLIERGLASGPRELEAVPAAAWIAAHGREHGFRTPTLEERGRAMGVHPLCARPHGVRPHGAPGLQRAGQQL